MPRQLGEGNCARVPAGGGKCEQEGASTDNHGARGRVLISLSLAIVGRQGTAVVTTAGLAQ